MKVSWPFGAALRGEARSEEHTSELQSQSNLVCRLLLEKKKMHVHLGIGRHVAVHDHTHAVHVAAAPRHVGLNEHIDPPAPEHVSLRLPLHTTRTAASR